MDLSYGPEYQTFRDEVRAFASEYGGRAPRGASGDMRAWQKLLIAHGYTDMVTPFAMTRYILDHMPSADPPGRVQLKLYRGGHMIYLDPQSRKAFSADAAAFYKGGE